MHLSLMPLMMKFRSSRPTCSIKTGVFKTFAKFTGKYLCQTVAQVLSCEFCKIFRRLFLQNTSGLLILKVFKRRKFLGMSSYLRSVLFRFECFIFIYIWILPKYERQICSHIVVITLFSIVFTSVDSIVKRFERQWFCR